MNSTSAASPRFALFLAFLAMLAHPAMLYARADVSCLAGACEYTPPDKDFTRYAGVAVSVPVPPVVETALLSFEAKGFYDDWPVSPRRVSLAIWDAIKDWHRVENTSGIEQQIAKNVFVGSERSLWRKYREAIYATKLYFTYSKVELLRVYAAIAQTGVDEYGFQEAAQVYLRKDMESLTLAEALVILHALPNPEARKGRYYTSLCQGVKDWMRATAKDAGYSEVQTEFEIEMLNRTLMMNKRQHPYAFRSLPDGVEVALRDKE